VALRILTNVNKTIKIIVDNGMGIWYNITILNGKVLRKTL